METAESPGVAGKFWYPAEFVVRVLRSALDVAAFESVRPQLSVPGSRVDDLGRL